MREKPFCIYGARGEGTDRKCIERERWKKIKNCNSELGLKREKVERRKQIDKGKNVWKP